jgi:membrane-associated phospholipid phosphatase
LYDWVTGGVELIYLVQQHRTLFLDLYFKWMTFLGNEEFFLLLLPLIYWVVHKQLGRRLVYLLVFSLFVNSMAKNLFRLPRPPLVLHLVDQGGYGFPSGHAMNAVALWGYIARHSRQAVRKRLLWQWLAPWILTFALWIVGSTAFSRIYLGVHYPADTLVGLALGLVVLWVWGWVEILFAAWWPWLDKRLFPLLALVLSLVLLFVHPGNGTYYPTEDAATTAGLLLGISLGFFYEARWVRFRVQGPWRQRLWRYWAGVAVIILSWLGLRILFGLVEGGYPVEISLRFARYALTGCALTWWAPAAFVRLGLAQREDEPVLDQQISIHNSQLAVKDL